ncbi:MAG: AMP-binding protein [Verrucomicrobiia bacterium]
MKDELSIRKFFAGKNILLTGATGFLAKAITEKILWELPDVGKIYLLIRPKKKGNNSSVISSSERLKDEVLKNSAFTRLREKYGENFESFCEEKIEAVSGDLTLENLGFDITTYNTLASKIDVVINSAATVVFDERLDMALNLNTFGPMRLLKFAKDSNAIFIQISTAYVCGRRTGLVPERLVPPLEAIDAQLPPGIPRPERFVVEEEIENLKQQIEITKEKCLRELKKEGIDPDSDEGRERLEIALVDIGMKRAKELGWNDTYTFTKYLGEQLIYKNRGSTRLAIVRPSIIESSVREPEPGWLDGLRMADPIIIGFGKGRLNDFPANLNIVLDIIPADFVVNVVLAAAAYIENHPEGFELFTIASSTKNPLWFEALYENVRDYFVKHPFIGKDGKPIKISEWQFPTIEQYRQMINNWYIKPAKLAYKILNSPIPLPGSRRLKPRIKNVLNRMEQLMYYVDIYGPYVNLDCRFETEKAFKLLDFLTPEERQRFDFDPRKFHWRQYLQEIHIPGLKKNILRMDVLPRTGAGHGKLLDEGEDEKTKLKITPSFTGTPQTIVDLAQRGALLFGNKPFLNIKRERTSDDFLNVKIAFDELYERARTLAAKLVSGLGLHRGDRIVLSGENCPEWGLSYLAISCAGCTAVPLDRSMSPHDVVKIIKLVQAKAAILSPTVYKTAGQEISNAFINLPCLNLLQDLEPYEGKKYPFPVERQNAVKLKDPVPESIASILFTSGTTLEPKGVVLTHSNFISNALAVSDVLEPLQTDRFLSVLPLHHAFEFTCGFLIPMYGGASVHYIETLRAQDVLSTMKLAEITVVLGVPRLFKLFMDGVQSQITAAGWRGRVLVDIGDVVATVGEALEFKDIRKRIFKRVHDAFGGNIRLFVSGGAALDPEIFYFFRRLGITICEGYGLTETSPVLAVNPLSAPKAGSVGPPVPGIEINIADVDDDDVGEILVRGPSVMQGYWQNPAATEKAFEQGWFKTGDLGKFDEDGYLHISGRLKDIIVTSAGKKVHPDEIEYALKAVQGVKELCVVGLPDKTGVGEEVAVVAVPADGASKDAIIASIAKATKDLPSYQHVSRVEFYPTDLPKTSTLKIQRAKVKEYYLKQRNGAKEVVEEKEGLDIAVSADITDSAANKVKVEVIRAIGKIAAIPPAEVQVYDKLQMDLGIDSIGRVDLLQELEMRLGINLPTDLENKLFTVKDVIHVVEEALKVANEKRSRRFGRSLWERATINSDAVLDGLKQTPARVAFRRGFEFITGLILSTYLRVRCDGIENLPKNRPFIIAANHCSHLDLPSIRKCLGRLADNLHAMAARDYFFNNFFKSWFFKTFLNALPLDREANAAESLAICKTAIDAGRSILLFPEGTRSVTGDLQHFKPGIGVLAIELDTPIVPVYLSGTYAALPKGRIIPRSGRIEVRFGKPVDFSDLKKQIGKVPTVELYRAAVARLREHIERLSELPPIGK